MDTDVKLTFRPGSKIAEKYEIVKVIGEGSLGDDVYLGKQTDLDRDVKIRVLPHDLAQDQEMLQRFIQETKLTAALQHPNILRAYETGEFNERYYLVTAAEKGTYLEEYLSLRGILQEKEAINLIIPLADALRYSWEENKIIHRNIKPDTIFIARGDQPILEDFGMAKSFESQNVELTMGGFTIGNPDYMSPEQVKGERDLDFRADMYCLGLVFYEMVTGEKTFDKPSAVALMQAHLSETPRPVNEINPRIHPSCAAVINKMLAKDKNERYESWSAVIRDLKSVLADEKPQGAKSIAAKAPQPTAAPKGTAPPVQSTSFFKSPKFIASAIVVGTIVIVLAILIVVLAI